MLEFPEKEFDVFNKRVRFERDVALVCSRWGFEQAKKLMRIKLKSGFLAGKLSAKLLVELEGELK